MKSFKANNQLTKWTKIIFILVTVLSFLAIFRRLFYFHVINISAERNINHSEVIIGKLFLFLIGIPNTILLLLSLILFLCWFYRSYWNLHNLSEIEKKDKVWMSLAGFIIPALNLFKPYQIMEELWVKSQQYVKIKDQSFTINRSKTVVGIWWTFYLTITSLYISICLIGIIRRDYVENMKIYNTFLMLFNIACIPAAIFTWILVNRISKFEEKYIELNNK